MPRKGYRTIVVTDEVYQYIQKRSAETGHSIPEYIKILIEKVKKNQNEKSQYA